MARTYINRNELWQVSIKSSRRSIILLRLILLDVYTSGLFHGKDVQFGHTISHSKAKSLKKWHPNVINKRVWSETLDDWVRFKMTTTALKEIDKIGGIDNYILNLDNVSVANSNYITKMRNIIGTSLFHQGLLNEMFTRKLGFHRNPPVAVEKSLEPDAEQVHFA